MILGKKWHCLCLQWWVKSIAKPQLHSSQSQSLELLILFVIQIVSSNRPTAWLRTWFEGNTMPHVRELQGNSHFHPPTKFRWYARSFTGFGLTTNKQSQKHIELTTLYYTCTAINNQSPKHTGYISLSQRNTSNHLHSLVFHGTLMRVWVFSGIFKRY